MIEIPIPKMGMSTVEVDVIEVMIEPGIRVEVGDPIVEVESEKVTVLIESEHAGTVLEVLLQEGETYEVGDIICRLEPDGA